MFVTLWCITVPWLYIEWHITKVKERYYNLPEKDTRGLFLDGQSVGKNWCKDCCHGFFPHIAGWFFDIIFGGFFLVAGAVLFFPIIFFVCMVICAILLGLFVFFFIVVPVSLLGRCCAKS